ncbi:MAG: hypothetical protein L0H53_10770 [Candidatus Nitrosocosmicus sp.]|nr:hypothetical protein [Candidatus Nitrosocosmicus sp.]MDN5866688.1 hypothetical protein [Candidatus Nitrosocosmicus sp.]
MNSVEDFLANVHKLGFSVIDYSGVKVPCLLIENVQFENIMSKSCGKPNLIDTNLNIYDDGHHIFVNLNVNFLNTDLEFDFLLYANESIDFFRFLSTAGMLGIAPPEPQSTNIFFVQLPKKDQAERAFELIRSKLN